MPTRAIPLFAETSRVNAALPMMSTLVIGAFSARANDGERKARARLVGQICRAAVQLVLRAGELFVRRLTEADSHLATAIPFGSLQAKNAAQIIVSSARSDSSGPPPNAERPLFRTLWVYVELFTQDSQCTTHRELLAGEFYTPTLCNASMTVRTAK